MIPLAAALALVGIQRLCELWLARRHERRLRARGAVEFGAGHYPVMVALHAGWFAALALAIPLDRPGDPLLLLAYLALQPLRYWAIAALGERWTTRILVLPGRAPVRRGPYRWLRHPNYLVVALEIPLLPAAFGAWDLALAFGAANLLLLGWRIRIEERALAWAEQERVPPAGGSTSTIRRADLR